MKSPYEILKISKTASADEIKKSFRKLARDLHPDSNPDNPTAEDEFKEISGAHELISNPVTRGQYDRGEIDAAGNNIGPTFRSRPRSAGGRRTRPHPFTSFFEDREPSPAARSKLKGTNVTYTLSVSFLEAINGGNKSVSMTNGKRLQVTIPPNTTHGQTLRLKGQGMPGFGTGDRGDALVVIQIINDGKFSREGNDVIAEVPVTLPEAVIGGKIEVPTIDGAVKVNVPAGSNTGTRLRLKGKGIIIPDSKPAIRGDQYVVLKVVLPPKSDTKFTNFIKDWSVKNPYNVR